MAKRIVITPPSHPGLLALLFFILLAPFIWGYWVPRAVMLALTPAGMTWAAPVALMLLFLSPILGFLNVVVKRRLVEAEWVELDFVSVFGFPIPVARPKHGLRESLLAVNVGGAVVPLVVGGLMTAGVAARPLAAAGLALSVLVVALLTYRYSRVVEGVGVVVPGLLPPAISIISSTAACLLTGSIELLPAVAYSSAVYGTLIGADILNIWLRGDKIQAWLVSVGGAGTFDGIFISGVTAVVLAAALL